METPKPTWYAVRTAGKFREGQYYRNDELGVLGRMARKVGYLVPGEPPVSRRTAKATQPAKKAVKPRKKAAPTPEVAPDGESSTAE